jgi:hypothetical protein
MKIKTYIIQFFLFAIFGISIGCKKEIKSIEPIEVSNSNAENLGKWNLINVYGGISGVNEQNATGVVTWSFNNNILEVENNNPVSNPFSLPTGTYQYDVINSAGNTYLAIDQSEFGRFVITGDTMNINENFKSTGEVACGFIMILNR